MPFGGGQPAPSSAARWLACRARASTAGKRMKSSARRCNCCLIRAGRAGTPSRLFRRTGVGAVIDCAGGGLPPLPLAWLGAGAERGGVLDAVAVLPRPSSPTLGDRLAGGPGRRRRDAAPQAAHHRGVRVIGHRLNSHGVPGSVQCRVGLGDASEAIGCAIHAHRQDARLHRGANGPDDQEERAGRAARAETHGRLGAVLRGRHA